MSSNPAGTVLRLTGDDVLPLLHRISTQALLDLGRGTARPTLFCDFRGRLLHRALVYRARDGAVWLLRGDAPGAELATFLDRHVFRDQVAIEDRSARYAIERLYSEPGPREAREDAGAPATLRLEEGEGMRLSADDAGTPSADEAARILAGRPAHGHEVAEEFNPFEVGLGNEVHLDKGCYTGQEVLQRLVTYRSVRRGLARVRGDGEPPGVPADVVAGDERIGRLTSVADDPDRPGSWIGLAVVKLDALDAMPSFTVEGRALTDVVRLEAPRPLGRP